MIRASVVTPLIGDGLSIASAIRPRLSDIPGVQSLIDVTGANPPVSPNLIVCEAVLTDGNFAQVEADTNYLINWSEVV